MQDDLHLSVCCGTLIELFGVESMQVKPLSLVVCPCRGTLLHQGERLALAAFCISEAGFIGPIAQLDPAGIGGTTQPKPPARRSCQRGLDPGTGSSGNQPDRVPFVRECSVSH